MNTLWFLASFILFNHVVISHQMYRNPYRRTLYKWVAMDFNYPNKQARDEAIKRGQFMQKNVSIIDTDYHAASNRYFVTTPLFRDGIPATLSQVIKGEGILQPFPRWPNNTSISELCRGPYSVLRIHIDKCGLMWVIDTGIDRMVVPNGYRRTCPPKLLIYNLSSSDNEILRYEFPEDVITNRTLLTTIVTESYQNGCSDSFAYISDEWDNGLIVFDYARKESWRIEHKYFYPFPSAGTYSLKNITIDSMNGIWGLALNPSTERDRKLYFHSFSSFQESWVPVSVLKNRTLSQDAVVGRIAYGLSTGQRSGQSTVEVMTDDGIMIYPLLPTNEIACWNSKKPFIIENQHVLERDDEDFQFIAGMKLKDNKLFFTSTKFQNYYTETNTNGTDFKYRVMVIDDVNLFLKNTPCAGAKSFMESNSHLYGSEPRGKFPFVMSHGSDYRPNDYSREPRERFPSFMSHGADYLPHDRLLMKKSIVKKPWQTLNSAHRNQWSRK